MTMRELNRDIAGLIAMAKDYKSIDDIELAKACDIAPGTLRNKRSAKQLPLLDFWVVAVIAKLAGYRVEFVKERP